ncbi:MAG: hypothetical protein JWM82_4087, partial [Myxococcales bacterium]|nr:hypothetical protein [Myxococcales bacterium]
MRTPLALAITILSGIELLSGCGGGATSSGATATAGTGGGAVAGSTATGG